MTDPQAALGVSQLARLKEFINKRKQKADYYSQVLSQLPLTLPQQLDSTESAWHLYIIRLQLNNISKTHRHVFSALRKAGILVNLHYIPIYKQPYHQETLSSDSDYPESEKYYHQAISIPLYTNLSETDQQHVVNTLKVILS